MKSIPRSLFSLASLGLMVGSWLVACSDDSNDNGGSAGGGMGATAGTKATGGASSASGGKSSGGALTVGGSSANGGTGAVAGRIVVAGAPSSGGSVATAGAANLGGSPAGGASVAGASSVGGKAGASAGGSTGSFNGGTAGTSGGSTAAGSSNLAGSSSTKGGAGGSQSSAGTTSTSPGGATSAAGTSNSAGAAGAATCNTLDYSPVPAITATNVAQANPTPTGGVIADGTYYQVADKTYTGPSGISGETGTPFRSILVISGGVINQAGADATRSDRWTAAFTTNSPNVTLHRTCGRGAGGADVTSGYSVVGNLLSIYVVGSDSEIDELVFSKQ